MSSTGGGGRSHPALLLTTVLHSFTHAYGTMLIPLYVLIREDLSLSGLWKATLLVTIYNLAYFLLSYPAGVLADRYDRKWLLGIGLVGNAAAIVGMGLTRRYDMLVAMSVVAGAFGTLFHPAGNALVPAHYPKAPGMAIGLLGIGSAIGFFAGPQYAGWRATSADWSFGSVAQWQKPLVELGLMGLVAGVLFLVFAREAPHEPRKTLPLGGRLKKRVSLAAAVFSLREFSFMATASLASIYLQKAQGLTVAQTGFILGSMMLVGVITNPLLVWITPGRRRLPSLAAMLILAGMLTATIPHLPVAGVLPMLVGVYALQLGASSVADAGMFERILPDLRGRATGMFLSIAGTVGALGPWAMGAWTDSFRSQANSPAAYVIPFGIIGLIAAMGSAGAMVIATIGRADAPAAQAISETEAATAPMG